MALVIKKKPKEGEVGVQINEDQAMVYEEEGEQLADSGAEQPTTPAQAPAPTPLPAPPGKSLIVKKSGTFNPHAGSLLKAETFDAKAHTILAYGDSGGLKSWVGIQLAIHTLTKMGKTTRLIYADQGGFKDIDEAREGGLIDVFNLHQAASANAAMMKIARGEWPDENGVFQPWENNGGDEVGLYIFDSISGVAEAMMQDLLDKRQQLNEDVAATYTYYDEQFAIPGRAHYSSVQRNIRKVLATIPNIPVERIYMTALTGKGEEGLTKQIVYGPLTMGKALTNSIPALIGDLFYFERVQVSAAPTPKWENRAWFKPHPDPLTGVDYPAKVRLSSGIAELDAMYPKGYILQGQSIGDKSIVDYVEWRDQIGNRKVDQYKELLAKFKK